MSWLHHFDIRCICSLHSTDESLIIFIILYLLCSLHEFCKQHRKEMNLEDESDTLRALPLYSFSPGQCGGGPHKVLSSVTGLTLFGYKSVTRVPSSSPRKLIFGQKIPLCLLRGHGGGSALKEWSISASMQFNAEDLDQITCKKGTHRTICPFIPSQIR